MKTTAQLFNECLVSVPNDIKLELDMSFERTFTSEYQLCKKVSVQLSIMKKGNEKVDLEG